LSQNCLQWQCPVRYRKRGPDRSCALTILSFGEKIVKIGPADAEIICLREIIKKEEEEEEKRKKLEMHGKA